MAVAQVISDIKDMYDRGEAQGASHMIVAYDSFDGGDYPIYVMPGEDPRKKVPTNGDRVMECYRYSLGWESQSKEFRANHWEYDNLASATHDARVPKVAQTIYEQERALSSAGQFWQDWIDMAEPVQRVYGQRAEEILKVVDSF